MIVFDSEGIAHVSVIYNTDNTGNAILDEQALAKLEYYLN